MAKYKCENCAFRARYDRNPKSILGRLWKWHTGFCPGWKAYMGSLSDDEKAEIKTKYNLKR